MSGMKSDNVKIIECQQLGYVALLALLARKVGVSVYINGLAILVAERCLNFYFYFLIEKEFKSKRSLDW